MFYDWASRLSYIQCGHFIIFLNRKLLSVYLPGYMLNDPAFNPQH
jgi:hypothetical protein